mmetsp:Transcript_8819/g.15202  ORF Transcript_8819/g.15202 Transcript_8819/m.15202 type:complete len:81 (-) Transcript_8819:393-635(-)
MTNTTIWNDLELSHGPQLSLIYNQGGCNGQRPWPPFQLHRHCVFDPSNYIKVTILFSSFLCSYYVFVCCLFISFLLLFCQ